MSPVRPDRLLLGLLVTPLLVLSICAGGLLLYLRLAGTGPAPVELGPFHLQAWILPKTYRGIHPVAYIGEPSAAIATRAQGSRPGATPYYQPPDYLLRLVADGSGGLKVAERTKYRGPDAAEQWLASGDVLTMPFSGGYSSTVQQTPLAVLRPLSAGSGGGAPSGQFDLGFKGEGTWWYTLLDDERIAVLEDPKVRRAPQVVSGSGDVPLDILDELRGFPGGGMGSTDSPLPNAPDQSNPVPAQLLGGRADTARLRIGERNSIAREVQLVPDAVALGDAWDNGMTLAVLARPDKLFVLDRQTERLVERPELRELARDAIESTPGMFCFYYSGSSIIAVDTYRTTLRLHSSTGEMHEIRQSGQYYPYAGTSLDRLRAWILPRVLPFGGLEGDHEMRQRRAGRHARLDRSASQTGNLILPIGPDRFVLVDDVYQRLVVIEHSARDAGVWSASAGATRGGEL